MNKQVSLAVDAVARQLGGTSIDTIVLKRSGQGKSRIRLRFDKVVVRLMEHLQNHLAESVPDGSMVLLTLTAPIQLPSKTAAALEERIPTVVERRPTKAIIHGNRVQIRVLRHGLPGMPRVMGFVHNPDSDPGGLLKMTVDLVELLRHATAKRATVAAVERALILVDSEGMAEVAAYRYVCSQLHLASVFQKIFVVFEKRRAASL
jgi:hypothetical protein